MSDIYIHVCLTYVINLIKKGHNYDEFIIKCLSYMHIPSIYYTLQYTPHITCMSYISLCYNTICYISIVLLYCCTMCLAWQVYTMRIYSLHSKYINTDEPVRSLLRAVEMRRTSLSILQMPTTHVYIYM